MASSQPSPIVEPRATAGAAEAKSPAFEKPEPISEDDDLETAQLRQQQWANYLGCRTYMLNAVGVRLTLIPPGRFPVVQSVNGRAGKTVVEISEPYFLGAFEVTVAEFERFVDESGHVTSAEAPNSNGVYTLVDGRHVRSGKHNWRSPGFDQTPRQPVVHLDWKDAQAFCDWLTTRNGAVHRIPTEDEWAYAYALGRTPDTHRQSAIANLGDESLAVHYARERRYFPWNDGFPFTAPVGCFEPNGLGLFDMEGNVLEFARDGWSADFSSRSQSNSAERTSGAGRVLRGTSWWGSGAAGAGWRKPLVRIDMRTGFRIAVPAKELLGSGQATVYDGSGDLTNGRSKRTGSRGQ